MASFGTARDVHDECLACMLSYYLVACRCGNFGAGWACGSTGGCDAWKLTHENGGYCWTWVDEFYYGVITFLTIGYGDVSPHTKGGKALATLLVMMGVFSFTTLLAELNDISQAKRLGADKTLQCCVGCVRGIIHEQSDRCGVIAQT